MNEWFIVYSNIIVLLETKVVYFCDFKYCESGGSVLCSLYA